METIIKKDVKSNVTVIFVGLRILLPYLTVKSKLLCLWCKRKQDLLVNVYLLLFQFRG